MADKSTEPADEDTKKNADPALRDVEPGSDADAVPDAAAAHPKEDKGTDRPATRRSLQPKGTK